MRESHSMTAEPAPARRVPSGSTQRQCSGSASKRSACNDDGDSNKDGDGDGDDKSHSLGQTDAAEAAAAAAAAR